MNALLLLLTCLTVSTITPIMGCRAVFKRSLQLVEIKAATVSDLNFGIPMAGCGSKRKTNFSFYDPILGVRMAFLKPPSDISSATSSRLILSRHFRTSSPCKLVPLGKVQSKITQPVRMLTQGLDGSVGCVKLNNIIVVAGILCGNQNIFIDF